MSTTEAGGGAVSNRNADATLAELLTFIAAMEEEGNVITSEAERTLVRLAKELAGHAESTPPNPPAWQGMESAPRDGSRCIGVNRSRIVGEVYFDRFGDERWHWADGTVVSTLTHWQPLPAPPAEEVGG